MGLLHGVSGVSGEMSQLSLTTLSSPDKEPLPAGHPLGAQPSYGVEKKGGTVLNNPAHGPPPDSIPIRRSLQIARFPSWNRGGRPDQIVEKPRPQAAIPWTRVRDGLPFILKRLREALSPALFRHCATSTQKLALPQRPWKLFTSRRK